VDAKSAKSQAAGEEEDDSELFGEDFAVGYVKSLLRIQGNIVKLPGQTEHYDIYLGQKLYPVLLPAVEDLSKEYNRQQEEHGKYLLPVTLMAAH